MPNKLYALAACRLQRGLSLEDLATSAGVRVATIKRLEQGGEPSYVTTRALARALDVLPHVLMHDGSACGVCEFEEASQGMSDAESDALMLRLITTPY